MTDPAEQAALQLLADIFHTVPAPDLIRAKCPRCRRWCIRDRYSLSLPCYLCADIGEPYSFMDLLLMTEYGISWATYQRRLETYGPPWVNLREWTHSRKRQTDWQRSNGTGRPQDTGD